MMNDPSACLNGRGGEPRPEWVKINVARSPPRALRRWQQGKRLTNPLQPVPAGDAAFLIATNHFRARMRAEIRAVIRAWSQELLANPRHADGGFLVDADYAASTVRQMFGIELASGPDRTATTTLASSNALAAEASG